MDHTGDLPGFVRDMLQLNCALMKCQLACSDHTTVNWIAIMNFMRLLIIENEHIDIFILNSHSKACFEENGFVFSPKKLGLVVLLLTFLCSCVK